MLAVFVLRLASLSAHPIPYPSVPDEFSYLYAAKTFASGHLSNPTPDLWSFFETQHILSYPTSMSKYQPGSAILMAASHWITGEYYWGVVFSASMMIGSIYWSMRGWTSRLPSFGIALFFLILFRAPHYWINSYWGGSLGFTACMLMIGAYPRFAYQKQNSALWIATLGVALGALSRPFECMLCAIVLAIAAATHRLRTDSFPELRIFLKPALAVFLPLLLWQGYYNYSITGSTLEMPYMLYTKQYAASPMFFGQHARPEIISQNPIVSTWQQMELNYYQQINGATPLQHAMIRTPNILMMLLSIARRQPPPVSMHDSFAGLLILIMNLIVPMSLAYCVARFRTGAVILAGSLVSIAASALMLPFLPHYLVMYISFYLVAIVVLCTIWLERSAKKTGVRLIFATVGIAALIFAALPYNVYLFPNPEIQKSTMQREEIQRRLEHDAQQHLVFVDHSVTIDRKISSSIWIYNEPHPDTAKIIWARNISPAENKKLIDTHPNRTVWYIEPYEQQKLIPYTEIY